MSDGFGATCTGTAPAGSCWLTSTTRGTETITASYAGDNVYAPSSGTQSLVINPASSTTAVGTITPEPSIVGQAYAVAYTVTSATGTPTGNVTVTDGSAINTCTVLAATCSITSTTAGSKTITVTYAGDSNFAASSNTKSHAVLTPLPSPSNVNASMTSSTKKGVTTYSGDINWSYGKPRTGTTFVVRRYVTSGSSCVLDAGFNLVTVSSANNAYKDSQATVGTCAYSVAATKGGASSNIVGDKNLTNAITTFVGTP